MTLERLKTRLEEALQSGDIISETEELIEDLQSSSLGLAAIKGILDFMEENPQADFGAPGPLVHFVEQFYKRGYEIVLLDSVLRQPTAHTVWMLNRVINGTKDADEIAKLINVMKTVKESPKADNPTRMAAQHFLGLHV